MIILSGSLGYSQKVLTEKKSEFLLSDYLG